jgi:hypothetical protein
MQRIIGSTNTPRSLVSSLVSVSVASSKCGYAIYRYPRKAEPLTASLFESLIAKIGPAEAASAALFALKHAA